MNSIFTLKKTKFAKLLAILLCVCLLAVSVPVATASDISSTKNKISELESEKKDLDNKLSQLKEDEGKAVEYQETLEAKIEVVQEQIDQAHAEIEALDKSIAKLEKKIKASQDKMGDTMDQFYDSVKALYKSGSGSTTLGTLEVLFNSNSLNEYYVTTEAMRSVTKYNESVMEKLQDYMDETEDERAECAEQKERLAEVKKELDKNRKDLEELQAENEKALARIRESKAATQNAISENEEASADLMGYLEGLIAAKAAEEEAARQQAQENGGGGGSTSPGATNPDFSGYWAWPIPGVTYVSQHYGNNGHKGIDIAGPYGTPIVAAEAGQVIEAGYHYSWGNYVLIYHDQTYTTRYAHLSSFSVGSGEYVSRGQMIGREGSTGNSTGPHLHFEVYQYGSRINPWPFIS